MKKNIYYAIKSIQEYCFTFSCCCEAGFRSYSWSTIFTKKNLFYASLILLAFGQGSIYGQKVSGASVQANFGIDADVYANHEQFTVPPVASSTVDDWFLNTTKWPGSGLGVIDESGDIAAIIVAIKANSNYPFERRMSKSKNTTVGNFLWIDAVYGRDGNSSQGNKDGTVFTKTTDKNGQSPATWNLGAGGSPQKNDIVDVFGHLRRDLTGGGSGILWGFGGATTMSADGNAHNDFEYFRTDVTFDGSKLINTGANEGHTAWQFNGTGGAISVSGDILVSVDFENGGTKPLGSVRVWMKKTDVVVATFNSNATSPNRPFDITGVFDGTSGAMYGYAEIAKKGSVPLDPNAINPDIFAVVNVTADTFGAPWGSLEGPTAKYFDDIKKLQFSEFGINLTALGLDSRISTGNPCENLLGTLIVKTRSSSSFTAELKDFAGPYKFGNTETPVVSTQNLAACQTVAGGNPAFNLNNGVVGTETTAIFYTSNPNPTAPTPIATPGSYTPGSASTTIYVRTEPGLNGCFAYGSFTLTVNSNPAPSVNNATECVGATATFSTTSLGSGFTYQWYRNNTMISVGGTGNSYTTPTLVLADDGAIYKVVVTNTTTTCSGQASGTLTIKANPSPPTVVYNAPACNENTFSIRVTGVINGAIYTVKDKNGNAIAGLSPASPKTASSTTDITFSNIPAGSGYSVSVSNNGCVSGPEICPIPSAKLISAKTEEVAAPIAAKTINSGFDAYPVPFKDQLTIKYNFDYVSDVKIEVFNAQGIRVLSKRDTNSYLNKEITLDLRLNKGNEKVYIVKLTTDRESSTKKVMSSQ